MKIRKGRPTKIAQQAMHDWAKSGYSNPYKKNLKLTHKDIAKAIKRFLKNGGKIKVEPPAGNNFLHRFRSEEYPDMEAI